MTEGGREVVSELVKTADLYNESLGESKIQAWLEALGGLDAGKICRAFQELRRTQAFMPRPAHVRALIEGEHAGGGHPGPEEAWALVGGMTEDDTVVWTEEIAEAWGVVRHLEDRVAARMAFLEVYRTKLGVARAEQRPPRWTASVGWDPTKREGALREAEAQGKLSPAVVRAALPPVEPTQKALTEGQIVGREQVKDLVRQIGARLAVDRREARGAELKSELGQAVDQIFNEQSKA